MKTLILNGSPRLSGDTASLLDYLTENLKGSYMQVDAYRCNISPCIDCRACKKNKGCAINDDMQQVYEYIQNCDNIIIASPIYFSELTGQLLNIGSRLQTYFCSRYFRKEVPITKSKKGAVILVGAGDGSMNKAYDTALTLLKQMNCREVHELVFSHNTDIVPAIEDIAALSGIDGILRFFNE